ncbi:ubiquitin-protein transferase [Aureococcus anophagefferens]|nr:ubiquitin-protein transferase [Aureococcus anophagefferens]
MESDASAENTATEREASPWRLAFDALRRSLWTRRSTDDALSSCGEESAPFPWPDLEMAEYEYARQLRDDEYGRRGLEASSSWRSCPRVSADAAVKGFLRDRRSRGPGGAVDVYVPFDGASGSSKPVAFLALRDRGAAARVVRALDGTRVDLPPAALNGGARRSRARPFGQRDGLLPPAAAGAPVFSGGARRQPAPPPRGAAAGGATSDDHEHETEPDDDDGPRAPSSSTAGTTTAAGGASAKRTAVAVAEPAPSQQYLCPITLGPMVDPCLCADGHSYERRAIAHWFASHSTSPLTNQRLDSKDVIANHALRKAILRHTEQQAASA